MKRRIKQGFTLVELVIVIAVIAILAAVLIPTFSNLITKANNSVDTQLIRNLNLILQEDKVTNGKHQTLYDANEALKESGYDVSKMNLSSNDYQLLWDSVNDIFCYSEKGKVKYISDKGIEKVDGKHNYFAIYDNILEAEKQTFSIYYIGNDNDQKNVTVGFDAGTSEVSVNYETDSDNKVIIRTNGGNLTVNAPKGDITHYGAVNKLNVIATDPDNCFHEYGFVYEFGNIFPDSKGGTGVGKYIAEDAKFHQEEEIIKEKFKYKSFVIKKVLYNQHYYGPNNESNECLCPECKQVNPNHICVVGKSYTYTAEDGKKYYRVDCDLCGKELFKVLISDGDGQKEICEEHNYIEVESGSVAATCTTPGIKISKCSQCGNIKFESTSALGHDWKMISGKTPTCTEDGITESKKCQREGCKDEIAALTILATGHDYDRNTHRCKKCNQAQESVYVDGEIIGAANVTIVDGKECFEFEDDYSYAYFVRTITFGFKSDYINKINGTYFKCDVEDVDIIGVFVTNPNLGKEYKEYDYAKECTFVAKDERQYLIDLYILSDKLIKIKCENDEECGLFQMYGLGVSTDSGNYLSVGAVEEIKFENFDTSDNNNFNCMFNFCYIKKLDISKFIIKKEATFDDFFKDCFITDGETAVKYPDNFPDEYIYKADNAQTEE